MTKYNLTLSGDLENIYSQGYLPQRNNSSYFYQDTSCRSNLSNFSLSSENRRILKKTESFSSQTLSLPDFNYNPIIQSEIHRWLKLLKWQFPINTVKYLFTQHIFNKVYVWNLNQRPIGYSLCYFCPTFSHIGYVFYNPDLKLLPIRMVLQTVIDSQVLNLRYCYLGRFSPPETGYYKRTMPGFEYFHHSQWLTYNS